MLIKFDITYIQNLAYAKNFPCAPATLFQAIVAANAHRLDEIANVLEALERGKCVRIVNAEPVDRITVNPAVPRLHKISEIRSKFEAGDFHSNLLKDESIFVLEDAPVHVSYYFDVQDIPVDRLRNLGLHTLGRGRSRCISLATAVDTPLQQRSTDRVKVWEPAATNGGRRMNVPYEGFLSNLRLYYSLKKSSSEVPQVKQAFSTNNKKYRYTMFKLYDKEGETFSWPAERTAELAGMLRHAVIEKMQTAELKEYASGHRREHVSYLPLPTLGKYTDGRIRRAVIAEPAGGLELPTVRLSELKLFDNASKYVATAVRVLKSDGVFDQYLMESKQWITVTPAILPGFDDGDRRKRQRLIAKMFEHAELPTPVAVTELQTQRRVKANSRHGHDKYKQVSCVVEFAEPISGVVACGTGRNYGVGVFANVSEANK